MFSSVSAAALSLALIAVPAFSQGFSDEFPPEAIAEEREEVASFA